MQVAEQIARGVLVCPVTRNRLDTHNPYPVVNGVPILLADRSSMADYAGSSDLMNSEYKAPRSSWLTRLRSKDYRTLQSRQAMRIFDVDGVCLAVGGGPSRAHPNLTNLNIGPFPNVDVVGDAHQLPYADDSVDAIYCEAVLEHLHSPSVAVAEMRRVLKPDGRLFACTPFMQHYHGYPHHYQNFTITGHKRLFRDFDIEEAGTCVGPVNAINAQIAGFLGEYLPRYVNILPRALWATLSLVTAPLDLILANRPNAYVLASTTYLVARKPS